MSGGAFLALVIGAPSTSARLTRCEVLACVSRSVHDFLREPHREVFASLIGRVRDTCSEPRLFCLAAQAPASDPSALRCTALNLLLDG